MTFAVGRDRSGKTSWIGRACLGRRVGFLEGGRIGEPASTPRIYFRKISLSLDFATCSLSLGTGTGSTSCSPKQYGFHLWGIPLPAGQWHDRFRAALE
jgi:hypothetical protein